MLNTNNQSLLSGCLNRDNMRRFTCRHAVLLLAICCVFLSACSDSSRPPYIKAQVLDVYNKKTIIYNAHFKYAWQERGETAFLDSYSRIAKELMAALIPEQSQAHIQNTHSPVRIPLKDINKIEWVLTGTGKKMLVHTSDGQTIETECLFPQDLRVNPESGLADYTCFIIGNTKDNSAGFDFSQSLDFLKAITVLDVANK